MSATLNKSATTASTAKILTTVRTCIGDTEKRLSLIAPTVNNLIYNIY